MYKCIDLLTNNIEISQSNIKMREEIKPKTKNR